MSNDFGPNQNWVMCYHVYKGTVPGDGERAKNEDKRAKI